jgi:hypothetical protein
MLPEDIPISANRLSGQSSFSLVPSGSLGQLISLSTSLLLYSSILQRYMLFAASSISGIFNIFINRMAGQEFEVEGGEVVVGGGVGGISLCSWLYGHSGGWPLLTYS